MQLSLALTIAQWLVQAHLSTEGYQDAMTGLRRVRRFKLFTRWLSTPLSGLVRLASKAGSESRRRHSAAKKTLEWSKESTYEPHLGRSIVQIANYARHVVDANEAEVSQ